MDKRVAGLEAAVAGVEDGSTVLIAGFGPPGNPHELVGALYDQGARDLTIVANGTGGADSPLARLIDAGRVRKVIASFPRGRAPGPFEREYKAGRIELELVPQGTMSERMRAAAAGIAGFYTRVSVGTPLAEGKEERDFDGVRHVLETPIHGDLALIKAHRADRWGNLVYRKSARNFNPVMAKAGRLTVVQVSEVVELGEIDPDQVHTPGIFIDRIVVV